MKTGYRVISIIFFSIFIAGCAASYHPINPESRKYKTGDTLSDISMMYKYDVLALMGNKRYAKREMKAGMTVVSVKITNNTDSALYTSRMKLFCGNRQVIPVNSLVAAQSIKQGVVIYLLYALLVVGIYDDPVYTSNGIQEDATYIPVGIPIAAGNMIGAGAANTNLRNDFLRYDISDKTIKPGETLYGIVTLKENTHEPLRVEF